MKRTVLHFSVRRYSEIPLEKMAAEVADALGCPFERGEFNGTDAFIAHFLGLNVHLYDWRGLNNKVVYVLASVLEERKLARGPGGDRVALDTQEISPAVADLLAVREGGDWHPVTDEEIDAEREHASRLTERFRREEEEAAKRLKKRYQ